MAAKTNSRHSAGFVWLQAPEDILIPALAKYGQDLLVGLYAVAQYNAQIIANYARQHAAWTDRTGNARAALHAIAVLGGVQEQVFAGGRQPEHAEAVEVEPGLVVIFLSHGVDYGKYLETIAAGKYAIIMPALQAHYNQVMDDIRRLLGA